MRNSFIPVEMGCYDTAIFRGTVSKTDYSLVERKIQATDFLNHAQGTAREQVPGTTFIKEQECRKPVESNEVILNPPSP
jgi:hypothetical protein